MTTEASTEAARLFDALSRWFADTRCCEPTDPVVRLEACAVGTPGRTVLVLGRQRTRRLTELILTTVGADQGPTDLGADR